VASVIVFDVLFVPPEFSLTVHDTQYLVTFAALLGLGLLISMLTARLQVQLASGAKRERRTLALYRLSKQLSALPGDVFLVGATGKHLHEMIGGEVVIYLEGDSSGPRVAFGAETSIARHPHSGPTAHWVMTHDAIAGHGTDTLPNAVALFVPLSGSQSTLGAIAVRADAADWLVEPEFRQWLESCANQLALALERDRMTVAAGDARVKAEAEQIRSTLLSSVSHDLKTPLAAIAGASSSLLHNATTSDDTRRELLETISEEAIRLNRLLENILQISRLDAGAVTPAGQWQLLEDIVGSALHRTRASRIDHPVTVRIAPDVPLILVDGLLLEQVFMNLLENAARYTPLGTPIEITARADGESLVVAVADRGPGLVPGTEETIFERYYRGTSGADAGRGSGLGLAICRAIVRLHGGTITAAQRPGGGADFVIRLPLAKNPPPSHVHA
jgi:two-component system sensor histidine kinase KdpD